MFQIGNKVVSKKTGNMLTGHVIGIFPAFIFVKWFPGSYLSWDKLYSDWRSKFIILVQTKESSPHLSPEEFRSYQTELVVLNGISSYDQLPKFNMFYYPQDDLELLSDDVYKPIFHSIGV